MKKILYLSDDENIDPNLKEIYSFEGFELDVCHSIEKANELFDAETTDLVIYDLAGNGFACVHCYLSLKQKKSSILMFVLSSERNEIRELKALDAGVDDFLYKPISTEVLLKRVKRLFDNSSIKAIDSKKRVYAAEGLEIDIHQRIVMKDKKIVSLTEKELMLLHYLIINKNILFSRNDLIEKLWTNEENAKIGKRVVDTYIKSIRAKLNVQSLITVHGIGYQWVEE